MFTVLHKYSCVPPPAYYGARFSFASWISNIKTLTVQVLALVSPAVPTDPVSPTNLHLFSPLFSSPLLSLSMPFPFGAFDPLDEDILCGALMKEAKEV